MKPVFYKILKFFTRFFLVLVVLVLTVNQFDAPLLPSIKVLLNSEIVISESEKLFYESFIAQSYCQRPSLSRKQSSELLDALADAAPFTSQHWSDFNLLNQCLSKLFEEREDGLFVDLTKAHKNDQPETERLIRSAIELGLKLQQTSSVLVSLPGYTLIRFATTEAEKLKSRSERYQLPFKGQIQKLIDVPVTSRLEELRDWNVRMIGGAINPNATLNPLQEMSSGFWGLFFFQKNRTLNNIYNYWNSEIKVYQCHRDLAVTQTPNTKCPRDTFRFQFYHRVYNPIGQAIGLLVTPQDIEAIAKRIEHQQKGIKVSLQRFK